ncbi:MAG: DUF2383 domain-containing protein [Desulfobulbaceae bacterium]|nr:DUF2383 domain-containing protein [Desulfobulbaceae bacterium]
MNKDETIKNLKELVQLDIDAVHAYDEAIDGIDENSIREQLARFREDHQRHITELSAVLRENGGTPPEYSPDFKGYLISGFTSLRSITGTSGAMKAMQSNEKLTNKKYRDAEGWEVDPAIKRIIFENREDERRHLAFIDEAIEKKIWEKV